MTEPPAPQRIAVVWSPEARADLRAIARDAAMQILHCLDRYLANRTGDVKKLKSPLTGFRLRCGDYRVFFDQRDEQTINVTAVRNRREASRAPYTTGGKNGIITPKPLVFPLSLSPPSSFTHPLYAPRGGFLLGTDLERLEGCRSRRPYAEASLS